AAAVLFLALGFGLTASGFGAANIAVTSSWLVTETIAVASLFSLFAIGIFAANAIVRDREYRFEEIVFTTPVGRLPFLLGRFGGVCAATLTAFALVPLGMIAAAHTRFHPTTYVWAFIAVALPTLLF